MKLNYAQFDDPRAIILAPTRELAIQIDKEIEEFAAFTDLRHLPFMEAQASIRKLKPLKKAWIFSLPRREGCWTFLKKMELILSKLKC